MKDKNFIHAPVVTIILNITSVNYIGSGCLRPDRIPYYDSRLTMPSVGKTFRGRIDQLEQENRRLKKILDWLHSGNEQIRNVLKKVQ